MVYQGTVRNGVVVFKASVPPDGTEVTVEPVVGTPSEKPVPTPEEVKAFWDKLMTFAGRVKGLPSDMAERHDHYRRERQKR